MEVWDVIVVGGGPAGAAAATWLAKEGFAVTLLDRAHFPRDKACGEFLTPQAGRLLAQLGVWETLCQHGLRHVAATLLVAPNGREMRHVPPDGGPTGYALRRVTLDAILLANARACGVTVREGFAMRTLWRDESGRVIGLEGIDGSAHRAAKAGGSDSKKRNEEIIEEKADSRGAQEPCRLRARLVIGADGSHSLVARQLGVVRPIARLQRIAVVAHWHNASGGQDAIEMRTDGPVVCGLGFLGGGIAASPSEILQETPTTVSSFSASDGISKRQETSAANTTFVVPNRIASQIAGRAGEWIEQTLRTSFPDLAERLAGATREPQIRTIGCFGHRVKSVVADGALLVGDAATFIDPFTGEGVYFSLRGAQLAAEVACSALRQGETSRVRLQSYQSARRELAQRYLLIDLVQSVVRTPSLLNQMVGRLKRFPGAADRLLSILGDTRPATDIVHPALLWRLFAPCAGNADQAFGS